MDNNIKLENIRTTDNSTRYTPRKKFYRQYENNGFSSVGLKIGLCIAICIALCIINLGLGNNSTFLSAYQDDSQSPGKLHFVELPGIIEVFAGGDNFTMPIGDYKTAEFDNFTNIITFTADSNATVVTCSGGTVKAIGEDKDMGNYIVIRHGDMETYYYGLGYVTVEERQVINKLDTLGLLTHTGVLYFKMCKNGKPVDPCEYLPIDLKK